MSDVAAKIDLARAHFEAGKHEQARALLERSLRQSPGHPDLCNAMSLVLLAMGRFDLALYNSERAVHARPQDPGFLQNLGNVLTQMGRHDEAIAAYERSVAIDPRSPGSRLGISHALRHRYRFAEATTHLRHALTITPDDPELLAALAPLLLKQARVEEAMDAAKRGLHILPGSLDCAAALAHLINYMPGATGIDVREAHQVAGRAYSAAAPSHFTHANSRDPHRRIRLGVLSGDLRSHAVAFFLEAFLERHDREAFHITCYSTSPFKDEVTARLESHVAAWKDLAGATPTAIAAAIHKDKTDILLELAGHMAGHSLPAVAMQPAPIQINFLGYPATTGLPEVTHRIVDSLTDPPGHDAFSTESLIRIDPSFLCYRPPLAASETPAPVRSAAPGLSFGSFNSAPKINRAVIDVWARLLNEVPGSTLTLKCLEYFDPALGPDIQSRFAAAGVDPARVATHTLKPTLAEHLAAYGDVDIALDPFPYNGTTTTFEALSMGVPVVTLRGERHVARVSSAILTNLGLPDLIADSPDAYIAIAKSLSADSARRAALRTELRPRLLGSVLCDAAAYAARLNAALRTVWREWCAARG